MYNQAALRRYQQQSVETSSPGELTLMLYNGLVKFLKLAVVEIECNNIEKANYYCQKSQNIIIELFSTLDQSMEVAKDMARMYDYMNRRLIQGNLNKDKAIINEVVGFAEQYRDTWVQVLKLVKNGGVQVG